jgi:hypothetical protein
MDRDTLRWTSEYGKTELVKDMTDIHALNILHFLEGNAFGQTIQSRSLIVLFMNEILLRGLKPTKYQIPHLDPKGRWRVWDFTQRRNVLLHNLRSPWP